MYRNKSKQHGKNKQKDKHDNRLDHSHQNVFQVDQPCSLEDDDQNKHKAGKNTISHKPPR